MVHKEDLLEMFITYDLEDLYGDFSDDGDGELELTEKGNEVATTLIKLVEQEIDRAREEVEKKFMEKYKKREEEMNVPYSEEDGQEFWQGYQEGYHQGLHDMIIDTYYLDKEFQSKLTTK